VRAVQVAVGGGIDESGLDGVDLAPGDVHLLQRGTHLAQRGHGHQVRLGLPYQAALRVVQGGGGLICQRERYDTLRTKHTALLAHCAGLEQQIQLYASVINLLTLEKHADDGKVPVTDLDANRQRRTRPKAHAPR
jgi:hypothetical protein